jgi:alpha-ketoglutarate-dependent taurine dioxygenase
MGLHSVAAPARPERAWRLSPFDLQDDRLYRQWREGKLARYPKSLGEVKVSVAQLGAPTASERETIEALCRRCNMALYAAGPPGDESCIRRDLVAFGAAFGLVAVEDHRSAERDGIVRIEVADQGGRFGYIPYTDRAINWHTDGYYNFHGPAHCVKAMALHCVRDAERGGENRLLDHEIAYIRLRDADATYVEALARPDAMAIPESVEADGRVRPINVGPVFYVDPASGRLCMRFTARKRNILWRDDSVTRAAVARLEETLESDPLVLRTRLAPGEGLLCNNVLHDRSAFSPDGSSGKRLLYRIRYLELIAEHDDQHLARGGRHGARQ